KVSAEGRDNAIDIKDRWPRTDKYVFDRSLDWHALSVPMTDGKGQAFLTLPELNKKRCAVGAPQKLCTRHPQPAVVKAGAGGLPGHDEFLVLQGLWESRFKGGKIRGSNKVRQGQVSRRRNQ